MKSAHKINLNAYDMEDRVGLVLSFSILTFAILLMVLYIITGFTIPAGRSESERVEIIRKTFFIKGLPVYAEFDSEKVVMTYLESEKEIVEEFSAYLASDYSTEMLAGALLIHLTLPVSTQTDLQAIVEDITLKVDAFTSLSSV